MARYAFGMRSTVKGAAAQAQMSLFSALGVGGTVREVGVSNAVGTAFVVGLRRFINANNVGAAQAGIGVYDESKGVAPGMTIFAGHGAAGGAGQVLRQWSIGAAIGASVVWTFAERGLVIPPGTGPAPAGITGIGPYIPTGPGEFADDYIEWDEP